MAADAESRARLEGQARMMALQLKLKRITGRPTGIPPWTIGIMTVVFLVLLGVVMALHLSQLSSYQRRLADLQANLGQIEHKSAAELWAAQAKIGQVTARATSAERLVNELRGKVAGLQDRVSQLEAAGRIRRGGPLHGVGPRSEPGPGQLPAAGEGQLGAVRYDDEANPGCKDPSSCSMASRLTSDGRKQGSRPPV
jgi:hypothetical protein